MREMEKLSSPMSLGGVLSMIIVEVASSSVVVTTLTETYVNLL